MAGTTVISVKELLKNIGILPDETAEGEREEKRLEDLHKTDRKQEQKLTFVDNQLAKVKQNQMSEEEFWRLLAMWDESDGDSDAT